MLAGLGIRLDHAGLSIYSPACPLIGGGGTTACLVFRPSNAAVKCQHFTVYPDPHKPDCATAHCCHPAAQAGPDPRWVRN
jgi:hypothetical protein